VFESLLIYEHITPPANG